MLGNKLFSFLIVGSTKYIFIFPAISINLFLEIIDLNDFFYPLGTSEYLITISTDVKVRCSQRFYRTNGKDY